MRQCEFKKRYDPDMDLHIGKHIYGEGITDIFKSVGRKLFGKTAKSVAKTAAKTAAKSAATKTGEYAGKKAGDKIVELLSKKKTQVEESIPTLPVNVTKLKSTPIPSTVKKITELTPQNVNDRVNQILSGGKLRRRNFI